ncbi:MAG: phosphoethanolamine--lipid A transferase [Desulfobulbaceae bacterium]|nr:phosphoethanolamine--lipid A transferase [Desulfobulbaceae bacterium]
MQTRNNTNIIILAAAIFIILFDNAAFFRNVITVYPPANGNNLLYIISLGIGTTGVLVLLLALLASRLTIKPLLVIFLMTGAIFSYFMNNYNVVIDSTMIQNILETNVHESRDLISLKLLSTLFFLGILPSLAVCVISFRHVPLRVAVISRLKLIGIALLLILIPIFSFSRFYASFFREHKVLRYYANPTYAIYSTYKYLTKNAGSTPVIVQSIGADAKIPESDKDRELIIVVVGEAARADRFSLNGYERKTNPLLSREDVIFYPNVQSCDTSTATSVPCMFSDLTRAEFSSKKAKTRENILDIVERAGVNVLWRDNNSDSKGVALRVPYEDYMNPDNNTICDEECRDEGMLVGLQEYIDAQKKDILIILHQMGNHGPAYYKRYPKGFEQFTPVCKNNQLEQCSPDEINNAYDNCILYTDFFLSKTIDLLKKNDQHFETALFYISDHGESLGEYGVYLHGMPYPLAPESQKHIAAILWFGENFHINRDTLKSEAQQTYSHDNLFHTLLGALEIHTESYVSALDILRNAHTDEARNDPYPEKQTTATTNR